MFERVRTLFAERYAEQAQRGTVFIDPDARQPYTFHLAVITITRQADPSLPSLNHAQVLEERLVGLRQSEDGQLEELPIEHLLLLRGGHYNNHWLRFVVNGDHIVARSHEYAYGTFGAAMVAEHRGRLLADIDLRLSFVEHGFSLQESELANARNELNKRAQNGNTAAQIELANVKKLQKSLDARRDTALATLHREPELIAVQRVRFIAHALVVPSDDPEDRERNTKGIETIAVQSVVDYERAYFNAVVTDVSTPASARAAGLRENPGFDLISKRPDGTQRYIEVKGRARVGEVEISDNEWGAAVNLRDNYWLYVVYDCATPRPQVMRVKDPFGNLLIQSRGVRIAENEIFKAAEP